MCNLGVSNLYPLVDGWSFGRFETTVYTKWIVTGFGMRHGPIIDLPVQNHAIARAQLGDFNSEGF